MIPTATADYDDQLTDLDESGETEHEYQERLLRRRDEKAEALLPVLIECGSCDALERRLRLSGEWWCEPHITAGDLLLCAAKRGNLDAVRVLLLQTETETVKDHYDPIWLLSVAAHAIVVYGAGGGSYPVVEVVVPLLRAVGRAGAQLGGSVRKRLIQHLDRPSCEDPRSGKSVRVPVEGTAYASAWADALAAVVEAAR